MNKRVIMRLELEPRSKKGLDEFCDRTGMTKVAALSRLIDWFCDQPDNVQTMIQGLIPTFIATEVAEIILKKLIATKEGHAEPEPTNGRHIAITPASRGHNGAKPRAK